MPNHSQFDHEQHESNSSIHDQDTKKVTTVRAQSVKTSMETPFIPPGFLQAYDDIVPGSAEKLLNLVVAQQQLEIDIIHREMALNEANFKRIERIDEANIEEQRSVASARDKELKIKARGQLFAVIFGLILISAAIFFATHGWSLLANTAMGLIAIMAAILFLQVFNGARSHHSEIPDSTSENTKTD